jgi:hypothetical protein
MVQASNSEQLLAHYSNTFEFSGAEVGDLKNALSGLIMSLWWENELQKKVKQRLQVKKPFVSYLLQCQWVQSLNMIFPPYQMSIQQSGQLSGITGEREKERNQNVQYRIPF